MLSLPVAASLAAIVLATASCVSMFAQGDQIDRAANPLTVGVVAASLIITSSTAVTAGGGPRVCGLPLFGLLGFLGPAVAGIWVLVSAWGSGWKK